MVEFLLLFELLKESIRGLLTEDRIGILFSGGLDSSIVTKLVLDELTDKQIDIVTVGVINSYDMKNAIQRAAELKFQLNNCYLNRNTVKSSIQILINENIVNKLGALLIAIPLFCGMKFLSDSFSSKMVVMGQGADELFGGYNKYHLLYEESKIEELKSTMKVDLKNLMEKQIMMEKKIAQYFDMNPIYPFLSPNVIDYAKDIPSSKHFLKTNNDTIIRKVELRKLAKMLNFSDKAINQPKKALQYGSGTIRIIRKIAREDGYKNLPEWFLKIYPN